MASDDARQRWDDRWAERNAARLDPAGFVVSAKPHLPAPGTAVDVAGGNGRNALWLAGLGLEVTLVDVSAVALDRAQAAARERGVRLETLRRDIEADGLPPGAWDVVLMHYFLDRGVVAAVPGVLRPGGIFVFCQPTVRNLERHERPGRAYLLGEGELERLIGPLPLDPILLEEGWSAEGRHEARLIARLQHQRLAT